MDVSAKCCRDVSGIIVTEMSQLDHPQKGLISPPGQVGTWGGQNSQWNHSGEKRFRRGKERDPTTGTTAEVLGMRKGSRYFSTSPDSRVPSQGNRSCPAGSGLTPHVPAAPSVWEEGDG